MEPGPSESGGYEGSLVDGDIDSSVTNGSAGLLQGPLASGPWPIYGFDRTGGEQQQQGGGLEPLGGGFALVRSTTPSSSTAAYPPPSTLSHQPVGTSSPDPTQSNPPINLDLVLGLGTPYQAFAGDESLNFLQDYGYNQDGAYDFGYTAAADPEVEADGATGVEEGLFENLISTEPPSITSDPSVSPLTPRPTGSPKRSTTPSRPTAPPILIDHPTSSSPDHSRPSTPHSAPITIDSHSDSGIYQPGDIEVEAPLKRTEGTRPEIALDSFRWAIKKSLSRARGEGVFPQAYKPPTDLPDWHRSTDWEYGIGTPMMSSPSRRSSGVGLEQTSMAGGGRSQTGISGQGNESGFATPQQYTSPVQSFSAQFTSRPLQHPQRSQSIPSPSAIHASPSALPAIIAQPPHRNSMLIPALHPGMHRPLPSPIPVSSGMQHSSPGSGQVMMNLGQQAYRSIQATPGPIGIPLVHSPPMHGQSYTSMVLTPVMQGAAYTIEEMESPHRQFQESVAGPSGTSQRKASGRPSGKRRATAEGAQGVNGDEKSPPHGRLVEESEPEQKERKKKKARTALSCAQCTKRKQRCNRESPCQHCTSRRIPEQCTPYVPGQPFPPMPKPPRAPKTPSARKGLPARLSNLNTATELPPESIGQTSPVVKSEIFSPLEHSSTHRLAPSVPDIDSAYSPLAEQMEEPDIEHMADSRAHSDNLGQEAPSRPGEDPPQGVPSRLGNDEIAKRLMILEDTVFHERARAQQANSPVVGSFPKRSESGGREGELDYGPSIPDAMSSSKISSRDNSASGREGANPIRGELSRSTSAGEDGLTAQGDQWLRGVLAESQVPTIEAHRGRTATIKLNLDDCGTATENLQRLVRDCGVSPQKLEELWRELPDYIHAIALVDLFFERINNVRYAIDEAAFREAFDRIYAKRRDNASYEASDVRSLPLIFIVFATSVMSASEELTGDEKQKKVLSLRLYWCSRRSILVAASISPDSLELVLTRLLSALYLVLVHDRRLTECWSQLGASLRTAQAIMMHRDGSKLGLDSKQTENRRRIWAYLYHADRHYSLILGRPPSIIDSYVDVAEPANAELSDIQPGQPIESKPLDQPTSATFTILRLRFAKITGKVAHHFQALDQPATYEAVQKLDEQILTFVDDLPPHYRMVDPDTSLDAEHDYIIMHRYIICTEILFLRIVLHRPWVLRGLKSDRYAPSRKAAFEAARMDFRLRTTLHQNYKKPVGVYFTSQFREFNAAMMAGMGVILSPDGPHADEMRLILASFLQRHPHDAPRTKDAASKQEVRIINKLYHRALPTAAKGRSGMADQTKESIDLLLGLRGDSGEAVDTSRGTAADVKDLISQPAADPETDTGTGTMPAAGAPQAFQPELSSAQLISVLRHSPHGQLSQSPVSATSHEDAHPQQLFNDLLLQYDPMSMTGTRGGNLGQGFGGTSVMPAGYPGLHLGFGESTGWDVAPYQLQDTLNLGTTYGADATGVLMGSASHQSFPGYLQSAFAGLPGLSHASIDGQSQARQSTQGHAQPYSNGYVSSNVIPTEGLGSILPPGTEDLDMYWDVLIDSEHRTGTEIHERT